MSVNVRSFREVGLVDLEQVGGKNASLGEMIRELSGLGVVVGRATKTFVARSWVNGRNRRVKIGIAGHPRPDGRARRSGSTAWRTDRGTA